MLGNFPYKENIAPSGSHSPSWRPCLNHLIRLVKRRYSRRLITQLFLASGADQQLAFKLVPKTDAGRHAGALAQVAVGILVVLALLVLERGDVGWLAATPRTESLHQ